MKNTFTLLSLFIILFSSAQPVIQYSNTTNVSAGITGTILIGNKPSSPGASGANAVWNFSSLTFTPVGNVSVVSPTATPFGSSFPAANWAAKITVGTNTIYTYNNIQPTFQDQIADNITAV